MTILQIDDIKSYMKYLLIDNKFDAFELIQASISTYNTIDIDGKINPEFFGTDYDSTELYGYEFTPWSKAKELAYTLIKGKYTPLSFKFVLRANDSLQEQILKDLPDIARQTISSLIINIRYDSQGLSVVTGTSQKSFSLDKTADEAWDTWVAKFIQDMQ